MLFKVQNRSEVLAFKCEDMPVADSWSRVAT